jgi:transposase
MHQEGTASVLVYRAFISIHAIEGQHPIPGIGPLTATALVAAVSDASAFKNGRQFAAWLGLVPRQHSTGGKERLLGISKRGDSYLRHIPSDLVVDSCPHKLKAAPPLISRRYTTRGRKIIRKITSTISIY